MYLALFFLLCTPKTHTLAENPQDKQRAYADLLRPKSCTCLVDYLTSVFSPLYTLTNVHTHTHTHSSTSAPLPLPFSPFLSQTSSNPMPTFPFFATLWLADLQAARTDQRQTGWEKKLLFIFCQRARPAKQAWGNNS